MAAAIPPLGFTTRKKYAELEWPIDILIAVVWVVYAITFFGTIMKRRTEYIYVANWFLGAFVIAVAVLHIVNSLAVPVGPMKSYFIYSGTLDAMVQWCYGHNAVGFFLTAGFLGMMYYFVPKQAERPRPSRSPEPSLRLFSLFHSFVFSMRDSNICRYACNTRRSSPPLH